MQVDTALLYEYFAADDTKTNQPDAPRELVERLNLERIPKHVSIIMDGNGRWAQARGKDRSQGHKAGVAALREAVTTSVRLGIDVLSVYAFSTENWKRPQAEVNLLCIFLQQRLCVSCRSFTRKTCVLCLLAI